MRRRRIVFVGALALLVVGPGALAILSDPKGFEDAVLGPRSEAVPVVETVGQLRRCRPVTVSGSKVRLGVSADEGPAGSALVVYALVEHPTPRVAVGAGAASLGPLTLRVEGIPRGLDRKWPAYAGVERLYATELPLALPGPVAFALLDAEGHEVARRTVRATDRPWHPFLPFAEAPCREPLASPLERLSVVGAAAVPHVTGHSLRAPPERRAAPLPTFEPEGEPTLTLGIDDEAWCLDRAPGVGAFGSATELLLARWWVDGNPVVPAPRAQRLRERVREVVSRPARGTTIRFHVHLDREVLGAHPGARVEVQLALCPEGWRFLDQEPQHGLSSEGTPRLSNRVEVPSR